jgi:hypothetical protein
MTSSTAIRYVTLEQYNLDKEENFRSRTKQDELLGNEFGKLHGMFETTTAKLETVETRLDHLSAGISSMRSLLGELVSSHQELQAGQLQMSAQLRNSLLRNPLSTLHAPVVYSPGKRPMRPEKFPQNAQEFYRLRDPKSEKQKAMILYLAEFYDITYLDKDTSDSEVEEDSTTNIDPIAVVEALESILGLVERNFIEFRESAQRYASEAPTTRQKRNQTYPSQPRAVKRTHFLANQGERSQALVALPLRPSSPTNQEPASPDMGRIDWYLKTPSDKAERNRWWKDVHAAVESASDDSSDNHPVQETIPKPVNASSGSATNPVSARGHPVQGAGPDLANASSGSATNPFPSHSVQGAVPDPLNASSGSTTNPNSASGRPSSESQSTGAHA